MRTRLLASVAVVAVGLLVPSGAFAADKPVITTPAASTSATNAAPHLVWNDVPNATLGFHVERAVGDCAGAVGFTTVGDPFAGAVSFTDNTVPSEGTYCYIVQSDDGLTVDSDPVTITYDTSVPAGTLAAPVDQAVLKGATNALEASNVSDTVSGVAAVRFERSNGAGWTTVATSADTSTPYTANWNTTGLTGTFNIRAVVTDRAGNAFSTSDSDVSVTVDNSAPTASVDVPASASLLQGTTNALSASASDTGTGVSTVVFQRSNGAGWSAIGTSPDTSSPYSGNWDTTGLSGAFNVRVEVTDGAGHVTDSAPVAVTVDNTPPTAAVTAPVASAFLHGSTTVTATASDVGSSIASVVFERSNGAGWTPIATSLDTTSPYSATWDTTVLNGSFDVHVVVTDAAGNPFTSLPITVTVDNTKPSTPAQPSGVSPVSAAPTISFSAATDTAGSGINHYDVYRNGGVTPVNSAPILPAGPLSFTDAGTASTSPPTTAGTYTYTVVAVDNAGNLSLASPGRAIIFDPQSQSAPTSVTALATVTSHPPQISWVAPAVPGFTLDHYKVYRDGTALPNVFGTTFVDTGVAEGTHTYQVVAADSTDTTFGFASAAVSVIFDTTAPAAPGGVGAAAALDGSVSISWAASSDGTGSGVEHYVVRRALSSVAPATVADGDAVCQGLVTSCSDTTALNGKLYTYAVFAVDGVGNISAAGVSAPVTARDQLAPAAPTGLAATPGDTTVALRWTAAGDDVAGYALVAKAGTAAPASDTDGTRVCTSIVAGSTSCTATGLTNGATYTFGLFALDEALNRSAPAVVTAVPNGPVTDKKPPAAVKGLSAKVSGTTVTLTWKNPADKDFDHVEITASTRKPSSKTAAKRVYSGKGTKAKTTLAAGASRWFVVVAYDRVGNASTPASVHATIAPASLFGPAPKAAVHGAVKLSWPVVKGARYYNVQLFAGSKRVLAGWPAGHALQLPKAKLKRGAKYTWYVWPGLGVKAKAHYGALIGKNTFTYLG